MPTNMYKQKYFIISVALALCAICTDFVAVHFASRATYVTAKSMTDRSASEADRVVARTESDRLGKTGNVLRFVSFGLVALCAVAWYMAARCHEPVQHLLLTGLLVSWCLMQFMVT
jgi:hypothetical protein